jgi:hypothetical protein
MLEALTAIAVVMLLVMISLTVLTVQKAKP